MVTGFSTYVANPLVLIAHCSYSSDGYSIILRGKREKRKATT